MNIALTILALLALWVYGGLVFKLLPKQKFIRHYLAVSALYFSASLLVLAILRETFNRHLPSCSATLIWYFFLAAVLISIVSVVACRFIRQDLIVHQDGYFLTSPNPRYLVAKSGNVLFQQVLIWASIFLLSDAGLNLAQIIILFSIVFGFGHLIHFRFIQRSNPYAAYITAISFFGGAVFPAIVLLFPYGFIYAYVLHWSFDKGVGLVYLFLRRGVPKQPFKSA